MLIADSNGGGDPHFSIILNDGKRLCYSVQGEKEHVFNLITCNEFLLNAEFVPDAKRDEVTWMGNIGVVIRKTLKYENSKVSHFRFDARSRTVYVGDTIMFDASSIEELTSDNGHISIVKSNRQTSHPRHPSVRVHLKDVGLNFTVKFEDEHLDWFWHSPIGGNNSHGLIGELHCVTHVPSVPWTISSTYHGCIIIIPSHVYVLNMHGWNYTQGKSRFTLLWQLLSVLCTDRYFQYFMFHKWMLFAWLHSNQYNYIRIDLSKVQPL